MPSVKVNADGTVTIGTPEGDLLISMTDENSVLIGGAGADTLIGGGGDDLLNGGSGDDDLSGNAGVDLLIGGAGNDLLNGGSDDDVMIGGSGSDTYAFGAESGTDVIMGFDIFEDLIDLSEAGIYSIEGLVTEDEFGNAVIDLGDGDSVTLVGTLAADLIANGNFVLAPPPPSGPVIVELGIDDTYTDAGDNVDHQITGDVNGEGLTDTDTFVFSGAFGNDTITDFQEENVDFSGGFPVIIPGDTLDLTAYGIFGQDYSGDPVTGAIAAFAALTDITFLDANGNELTVNDLNVDQLAVTSILHIDTNSDGTADSTLTLLGVTYVELGTALEFNLLDMNGGTGGSI